MRRALVSERKGWIISASSPPSMSAMPCSRSSIRSASGETFVALNNVSINVREGRDRRGRRRIRFGQELARRA